MKFTLLMMLLLTSSAWARWSVSTYNVRNFDRDPGSGKTDYQELKKIITQSKSDVMAFEEIVNVDAFAMIMAEALPLYRYNVSTCGGNGKQKIVLAYNPSVFDFVSQKEDFTFSGSGSNACGSLRPVFMVTLKMKSTSENYVFAGVHLKAGGDNRAMQTRWGQYRKLENLVQAVGNARLVLLGDFNTTGYNIKDMDFSRFNEFLDGSGMWTATEEIGCTSYWHGADQNPDFMPSALDHIVMSNTLAAQVASVSVGAHCQKMACAEASTTELGASYEKVSDHCPVQVVFK